jgi:hypothetical protein
MRKEIEWDTREMVGGRSGELGCVSDIPADSQFLQEAHGITSQKTAFSIVTAMKTSDLTYKICFHRMMVCHLKQECECFKDFHCLEESPC